MCKTLYCRTTKLPPEGKVWRNIQARLLDKLLIKDLQEELRARDRDVQGKLKPTLEKEFEELRLGINNFLAMLQDNPQASLSSINLQQYEISPTEPLHDLNPFTGAGDFFRHGVVELFKNS